MTDDEKFNAHTAKVYLTQARAFRNRSGSQKLTSKSWVNWLINAAGSRRKKYLEFCRRDRNQVGQMQLF